jgi:lysophospholipase L1-like esterase
MNGAIDPYHLSPELRNLALVNRGETTRLRAMFKIAEAGRPVTVAFIGGSITQGCNASTPANRYANRVLAWFRETFPQTDVTFINAGVGATTSLVGVHRAGRDVLDYNPDLVVIDFAVNDREEDIFRESYESLLRRILDAPSEPAVIALFMMIEGGKNTQDHEIDAGLRYGIPMISYRDLAVRLIEKGDIQWDEISTDEVHPNDVGHAIAAGLITGFLENLLREVPDEPTLSVEKAKSRVPGKQAKKERVVFGDPFAEGSILDSTNLAPSSSEGFAPCAEGFQTFRTGWLLDGIRESRGRLVFELEARAVILLYKRTIRPDSGTMTIHVGNSPALIIDTFFSNGWGDYAETTVLVRGERTENRRIEITASGPVTILGFLVS